MSGLHRIISTISHCSNSVKTLSGPDFFQKTYISCSVKPCCISIHQSLANKKITINFISSFMKENMEPHNSPSKLRMIGNRHFETYQFRTFALACSRDLAHPDKQSAIDRSLTVIWTWSSLYFIVLLRCLTFLLQCLTSFFYACFPASLGFFLLSSFPLYPLQKRTLSSRIINVLISE